METLLAPEDLATEELSIEELIEQGEYDPSEIQMGTYTFAMKKRVDKDM
jgi:hypothetical protein